ncbi:hypothetical protein [uncultured Sphingomonas sp.]|uniref:hypothetical protein n=1 Tax=uncultured Sphingomonas sp. TaxID=158754 RepID=UPI0025922436|nr:hypothetical protein [uncultured Sphingomonas sp.]
MNTGGDDPPSVSHFGPPPVGLICPRAPAARSIMQNLQQRAARNTALIAEFDRSAS